MTITPKTQLVATIGGLGVFLAAIIIAVIFYWLPKMSETHTSIHQSEAAITAIQRQQNNLTELSRQLKERQTEDEHLKKEMWGFLQEDQFFDLWDTFGTSTKTEVSLDSLADAAPGPNPIQREGTLTITGSVTNVLASLAAIPTITPAVVIQKVQFAVGPSAGTLTAQIICSSLWYDDTNQN